MINKKALNLFFVFCIVIIVCVFFSSTLNNISTPRVVPTYSSNGILAKETVVKGYIYSQNSEEVNFYFAEEYPILIDKINVKPGDFISAGELICEADSTPQILLEEIAIADENYDYCLERLLLEKAEAGVKNINFATSPFLLYDEILEDEKELWLLELELITEADILGLVDDSMSYLEKIAYLKKQNPDQLSEEISTIMELQKKIDEKTDLLKEKFDKTNGKGLYEYSRIIDAERNLFLAEYDLFMLQKKKNQIDNLVSPISGIVVEVNIEEGKKYSGGKAITVVEDSMLTVYITIDDNISKETLNTSLYSIVYNNIEYDADFVQFNREDNTVVLVFKNDSILKDSTLFELYGEKVSVKMYTEVGQGTLIPIEALQGYSDKQIVYFLVEDEGFWGTEWKIEAIEIEIVDVNSKFALIEESINRNQQIIVGWDRPIYDGQKVIPFSN